MNTTASTTTRGGVSILTVLWVTFMVLKLTGVITWSWWLVLLPLLLQVAQVAFLLLVIGVSAKLSAAAAPRR